MVGLELFLEPALLAPSSKAPAFLEQDLPQGLVMDFQSTFLPLTLEELEQRELDVVKFCLKLIVAVSAVALIIILL